MVKYKRTLGGNKDISLLNLEEKKKNRFSTIIFGAGGLGQGFVRNNNISSSDAVFCDNNPDLWGTTCLGLAVIKPEAQSLLCAERVIVVSSFAKDIYRQLDSLGVNRTKIFSVSKKLVTENDTEVLASQFARKQVLSILNIFFTSAIAERVDAFADYGTLLGLWRDGDLIANDGDVDISVICPSPSKRNLLRAEHLFRKSAASINFSVKTIATTEHSFRLQFGGEDFAYPVDIASVPAIDGELDWAAANHPQTSCKYESILPLRQISSPITALVPQDPNCLLKARYGSGWKIPNSDWSLFYGLSEDIQVITEWP